MAVLSKPKAKINLVAPEEDKKKSRRIGGDINTFFFSADFKAWCSGKSVASNKAKARF
jgi:hypothetical protein